MTTYLESKNRKVRANRLMERAFEMFISNLGTINTVLAIVIIAAVLLAGFTCTFLALDHMASQPPAFLATN